MANLDVYCEKYGFTKDENMLYLNSYLTNRTLKTVSIDLYAVNPYMLLSRTVKKNVDAVIDNMRFSMCDNNEMMIINILKKSIDDCAIKVYDDSRLIAILSIHNLLYRIFFNEAA